MKTWNSGEPFPPKTLEWLTDDSSKKCHKQFIITFKGLQAIFINECIYLFIYLFYNL